MSAKASVIGLTRSDTGWSRTDLRVLRYAVGATVAVGIAVGDPWPLSYLTPVLVLAMLAGVDKPITPKAGLVLILIVGAAFYFGFKFGALIAYPAVFIPLFALVLFRLFYAAHLGKPLIIILWILLAVLIFPLVRLVEPLAALVVAFGLFTSALVSTIIAVLAFAVIPEKPVALASAAGSDSGAGAISTDAAFRSAALSTAVIFPIVLLFYFFEYTSGILILAYVGILSLQPELSSDFRVGKGLVLANTLGGLAAVLVYLLLEVVPEFLFLLLLVLMSGFAFGSRVFSGAKTAGLFKSGFSTLLLIVGSLVMSDGAEGDEVLVRVFQIAVAVAYVVVGLGWLNRMFPAHE